MAIFLSSTERYNSLGAALDGEWRVAAETSVLNGNFCKPDGRESKSRTRAVSELPALGKVLGDDTWIVLSEAIATGEFDCAAEFETRQINTTAKRKYMIKCRSIISTL
jgi:hypothetical protein